MSVFLYLTVRSWRNLIVSRLRRLREPRYLVASLIGAGYLFLAFGRQILSNRTSLGHTVTGDVLARYHGAIEVLGSLVLFAIVAGTWLFASSRSMLRFSEAEAHFLFTAPVSRRRLVHFKLLRSQLAILLGVAVSAFFLGGRLFSPAAWPYLLGAWILFATLHLHLVGASFVRAGLEAHGVSGLRHRAVVLAVVLAWGGAIAWGLYRGLPYIVQTFSARGPFHGILMLTVVAGEGWVGALLAPFRILLRPLLLPDLSAFLPAIAIPAAVLALHYVWVVRSEAAFEESAIEAAETRARRRERRARGGGGRFAALALPLRRTPFRLRPVGRPETAFLWKNLTAQTRLLNLRWILVLSLVFLSVVVVSTTSDGGRAHGTVVLAIASFAFATMLFPLGAVMVRNDLRMDLLHLDSLRTYPVSGRSLVAGEVLAPALAITALQWALLVLAWSLTFWMPDSRFPEFLSSGEGRTWGLGALLLPAPAVNLTTLLIQNAIVLLFPAWVTLGAERAQGFEASGQRLLTLTGATVALVLLLVPPALAGAIAYFLTRGLLGDLAVLAASAIGTATLLVECAIGIHVLGHVMDRLDPSEAGIESPAA